MGASQSKKTVKNRQLREGKGKPRLNSQRKTARKVGIRGILGDSYVYTLGDSKKYLSEPKGGEDFNQTRANIRYGERSHSLPVPVQRNKQRLPRVTRLTSVHDSMGDMVELYWAAQAPTNIETTCDNPTQAQHSTLTRCSGLGDKDDCRELANEFQNKLIRVSRLSMEEYDFIIQKGNKTRNIQPVTTELN
ncbi:uncharacterized protein LOC134188989 [Corticium candelabrum]|uniref:uncharacterized protein LOC134188989 n=1 Tax=Corticium candelabrum TaxID=121492 RepID=UPI002E25AB39|nr:uncharacterized protein LOC134188989 [Corticium candelabrum]